MAEQTPKGKIPTWLKAGFSSGFGLVGGAILMYLTPLVNNAVKPPEPIANFGFQAQGLTVTLQNRSANATDGWWDFGDGTPLEQFSPQQPTVSHTYAKPGSYTIKLSLTNLFNEKSERDVTITAENTNPAPPVIESFVVTPLSPTPTVPAVFHIVATVKNAEQIIWAYGTAHPIEVTADASGILEKYVTVNKPGNHVFHIAAVAGKKIVQAEGKAYQVDAQADTGAPMATVTVTYLEAVQVDRKENVPINVALAWKPECKDTLCPVTAEWTAWPNYQIVKAELTGAVKDSLLHGNPTVEISPNRDKIIVMGEMVRPTGLLSHIHVIPKYHVPIKATLEKRSASASQRFELPMCVAVPGQTKIPLPALSGNWQATKRQITLDLREGPRSVWSGSDMPANRPVQLKGQQVSISAAVQDNQVVLTVVDPRVGLPRTAN